MSNQILPSEQTDSQPGMHIKRSLTYACELYILRSKHHVRYWMPKTKSELNYFCFSFELCVQIISRNNYFSSIAQPDKSILIFLIEYVSVSCP